MLTSRAWFDCLESQIYSRQNMLHLPQLCGILHIDGLSSSSDIAICPKITCVFTVLASVEAADDGGADVPWRGHGEGVCEAIPDRPADPGGHVTHGHHSPTRGTGNVKCLGSHLKGLVRKLIIFEWIVISYGEVEADPADVAGAFTQLVLATSGRGRAGRSNISAVLRGRLAAAERN